MVPMSVVHADPWEGLTPRKWQAEALPIVVDAVKRRQRAVISAVMGSGKSVLIGALARSALARLRPDQVVVVATPTQALVRQLSETIGSICGSKHVGQYYGVRKQADRQILVTCNPSLTNLAGELATQGRSVLLFVQDECHSSEAQTVKEIVPTLAPEEMVGFTATPFRSVASQALSLWDSVVYRYTLGDALRDGVLVPWRTVNWDGQGSDNCDEVCVRMIAEHGEGPGVASALSIADAEEFATLLNARGITAAPIHSRLGTTERDSLIARLKGGELRCLVHVSMLSEGVDFPWLRWLCLRRPVAARVRFMQEIGRPLRSCPGKTHAVLMDPHDLLGTHGVQHPEALGKAIEAEAEREEREALGEREPEAKLLPPAKALDLSTQWARTLLLSLQAVGAVPSDAVEAGYWRTRRPSAQQVSSLGKLGRAFARYLPAPHNEAVLTLSREPVARELQRGAVSDLISVLKAIADAAPGDWQARGGWSFEWPGGLDVPALSPAALQGLPTTSLVDLEAERRAWFEQHGKCPQCGARGVAYRKPYGDGKLHVGLWCDPCDRWLIWIKQHLLRKAPTEYPLRPEADAGLFGGAR
jgi:superfamily II DNA or RNA helicase